LDIDPLIAWVQTPKHHIHREIGDASLMRSRLGVKKTPQGDFKEKVN
jgi:hypothetical protein